MFEEERKYCWKGIDSFLRKRTGWLPTRIALAIMAWFGQVNLYMTRINLSVAIVAMVKRNVTDDTLAACFSHELLEGNSSSSSNSTGGIGKWPSGNESLQTTTVTANNNEEGEFLWDETTQGLVLGSFFYGYTLTQVLGGRLSELHGAKIMYGICILGGGTLAFFSPVVARFHYGAFIALRILQGMFQGAAWPSLHACISRWIPPIERGKFISIVYLAATLSSAITMPLVGVIIANHGWEAQFYVMGTLSLVWCCVWFAFMFNSPEEHPRISPEELNYIQTSLLESGTKRNISKCVPWREIATSLPAWSIFIYAIGNGWGLSLLFAQLPTFLKNILGFSIKANGAISALPFICRYFGGIMWGTFGDWLIAKQYLSITAARKIFSIIALWGPGTMIIGVSFGGCNANVTILLLCLALLCNGANTTSGLVNHTDIAPNFAGTLMGLDNTVGSITGFIVPVVTGIMTDGQQTIDAWQRVFWICAPMYIVTEIFFLIFSSGEVQPWNDIDLVKSKMRNSPDTYEPDENVSLKTTE